MANPFTPEQISQILEEFFKVVGTRQYIGARYVPIFGRKGEESIEWDNSAPYEPLTIVLYQGNSYTSRQYVPVGVEITNQEFWALTGNYNAQVEQYRRDVQAFDGRISANATAIANEVTRAKAAEQTNATAISNEVTRAKAAEQTNATAIDAEKTRAEAAESAITDAFKAADSGLKLLIDDNKQEIEYMKHYVTPEMYGAVGDGITDDSDAFKKALTSGMPVMLIKEHSYSIDISFTLSNDLIIFGNESNVTVNGLNITAESKDYKIYISDVNFKCNSAVTITMPNLTQVYIDINKCNFNATADIYMLSITGGGECKVNSCHFESTVTQTSSGIHLIGSINTRFYNNTFTNLNNGITLDESMAQEGVYVINNLFIQCNISINGYAYVGAHTGVGNIIALNMIDQCLGSAIVLYKQELLKIAYNYIGFSENTSKTDALIRVIDGMNANQSTIAHNSIVGVSKNLVNGIDLPGTGQIYDGNYFSDLNTCIVLNDVKSNRVINSTVYNSNKFIDSSVSNATLTNNVNYSLTAYSAHATNNIGINWNVQSTQQEFDASSTYVYVADGPTPVWVIIEHGNASNTTFSYSIAMQNFFTTLIPGSNVIIYLPQSARLQINPDQLKRITKIYVAK